MYNRKITDVERIFYIAVLDELLLCLSSVGADDDFSPDALNQNTLAICSAKVKLENRNFSFNAQEVKVIYWAISDFCDDLSNMPQGDKCFVSGEDCINPLDVRSGWRSLLKRSKTGRDILDLFD